MPTTEKEVVRQHWDADPCGLVTAGGTEVGSTDFFDEIERARYRAEPFIHEFANFEAWRGKDVLEVGVGLGTDFVNFVRAGARATAVDLTERAVELVARRLELERLDATVMVADAEELPFPDSSFDLVYSWGVLHHTPATSAAVAEVRRVLRRGGEARVMLYSRRSWVALGVWLRYALAVGRPWRSFAEVLASHMESPGTKAYTEAELRVLFTGFSHVEIQRWVTPYDRRVAGPLAELAGRRLGWFSGVIATR